MRVESLRWQKSSDFTRVRPAGEVEPAEFSDAHESLIF